MDIFRRTLWLALIGIFALLCYTWQSDYPTVSRNTQIEAMSAQKSEEVAAPVKPKETVLDNLAVIPETRQIKFKTDVLSGVIDLQGGHLVHLELLQYPQSNTTHSPPTRLLDHSNERYYVAQTDLTHADTINPEVSPYNSGQRSYSLSDDEIVLPITLYRQEEGVTIKKQFVLKRGDYHIEIKYHIHNQGEAPWVGKCYAQLKQRTPKTSRHRFGISAYTGAVLSTDKKPYEKLPFDKMGGHPLPHQVQRGWISFVEPYFASAWISNLPNTSYYSQHQNDHYTLGLLGPVWTVMPKQTADYQIALYAGPKVVDRLEAAAKHLGLIVDYGIFWFVANTLLWLLKQCQRLVGNWGLAIVIMTLFLKLVFVRSSAKSFRYALASPRLQPQLDALKARYGEDRQQLAQATMALYQREGIQPMSGLLSLLMQLPLSIALYWVLLENVELRHQPFILWIKDLSAPDPYYILPLLLALTGFIDQKIVPAQGNDPMQASLRVYMPLIFTFMVLNMPSGLLLYWVVQNIFSILQKGWIVGRTDFFKLLFAKI
jgi:YidC/Oxa1 family membrane protein insertase